MPTRKIVHINFPQKRKNNEYRKFLTNDEEYHNKYRFGNYIAVLSWSSKPIADSADFRKNFALL